MFIKRYIVEVFPGFYAVRRASYVSKLITKMSHKEEHWICTKFLKIIYINDFVSYYFITKEILAPPPPLTNQTSGQRLNSTLLFFH